MRDNWETCSQPILLSKKLNEKLVNITDDINNNNQSVRAISISNQF